MKSVLLIEKPNNCSSCKLSHDQNFCWVTEKNFSFDEKFDSTTDIMSDCPLVNLPDKKMCNERDYERYDNIYGKGWNDYRGHLTGEYNHYVPEPYKE